MKKKIAAAAALLVLLLGIRIWMVNRGIESPEVRWSSSRWEKRRRSAGIYSMTESKI